ncbi:hypothetical protein PM082_011540 [Marasmius tenuissimus]|nr:hypothetical protein PM082_011540 [Marasmius tenuissimus]
MAVTYTGSCYCKEIRYKVSLGSPEEAQTSLCHCPSCKKYFGGAFGTTAKIPKSSFKIVSGQPKQYESEKLHLEFCGTCGSGILQNARRDEERDRVYVTYGTLDEHGQRELVPKLEIFAKYRNGWMPQIPGLCTKEEM